MNLLPHIRALILQQPGGQKNWSILAAVVEKMTEHEKEAFHRTLKHAEEKGVTEGRRDCRRSPWKYLGS